VSDTETLIGRAEAEQVDFGHLILVVGSPARTFSASQSLRNYLAANFDLALLPKKLKKSDEQAYSSIDCRSYD
jgi:hypothetical protein